MKYILIAFLIYLVVINIIGFVITIVDKKRAQKDEWRIPEKTLFGVALLGGSVAMLASMKAFRHKTKHKRFMIGIPCIIIAQLAIVGAVCWLVLVK